MKTMSASRIITGCLFAFLLGLLPQAAFAQEAKPSGTVTIDEEQIRLLIGGSEGKGVLSFGGKQYRFTIKGLTAGGVGITKVHATGSVYSLKKVEDFSGRYSEIGAGATVGKGSGGTNFQNSNGVSMSLKEKSSGLGLSLGVGAFDVKLAN